MKDVTILTKIRVYSLAEADENTKILIEKAKKATHQAYAPYSGYQVGASLRLRNGLIISGSNQENAAFPSGSCAERTAIFYANANHPNEPVEAIAIIAYNNEDFVKDICTPCGMCRQVLLEVENRYKQAIKLYMCSKDTIYEVGSIKDLLPLSFGSEKLA